MALTKIFGNRQIQEGTISDALVAANAAIQLSKLENGTKILLNDGSVKFAADLDANNHKVVNVANATADGDAVNYAQLQQVMTQGKLWKEVVFTNDQFADGANGGIRGGQVVKLSANLASGDTITLSDGTNVEQYVAGTNFNIGANINATLANLAAAITLSANVALAATTDLLDSIDAVNNVMLMWQDTIGDVSRIYGNAGAAAKASIAPKTLLNLYEALDTDMVAIPTTDPAAVNFGFSKAHSALVNNETHMSRVNDSSYTWDNDANAWNQTGATSIPYASKSEYGKTKIGDGLSVSTGLIAVEAVANQGIKVTGSGVEVDYDNSTIGIVGTKLAVKAGGVTNSQLQHSVVTVAGDSGTDDVALGETLTFTGNDPIDTAISGNTVTISAKDASATVKGVAKFNSDDFVLATGSADLVDTVVKSVSSDAGAVTPSTHGITIAGTTGITTTGSGSTLTVTGTNASTTAKGVVQFDSNHFTLTNGLAALVADGVDETLIDFGSGANQVDATSIPMDSAGTYSGSATTVQDALEELQQNTNETFKNLVIKTSSNTTVGTVTADAPEDTVTFKEGTDISLTVDAVNHVVTISSSGSSTLSASLGVKRVVDDFEINLLANGGLKLTGNAVGLEVNDVAGAGLEDDGSDNLRISSAAAGNGLTGGSGSALAVLAEDTTITSGSAGIKVTANTITATHLTASVAGDGLVGGNATALSVNVGHGIAIDTDKVTVNLDGTTLVKSATGLKLADLAEKSILMGNASGIATASKFVTRESPTGAINGINASFALAHTPIAGTEQVFYNGQLLEPGASNDYTISAGTITMASAPVSGDAIRVNYIS